MRLIKLDQLEYLRVSGPDAISFLQGQVSCNMELLSETRSLTGALCNLKGRVIADFRVLLRDGDCLLQTQAGMGDRIRETLGKYAVFSKVEIVKDSKVQTFGLLAESVPASAAADRAWPEVVDEVSEHMGAKVVAIDASPARWEIWCSEQDQAAALLSDPELILADDERAWVCAELTAGIVHVSAAMTERFTPQLLNYDLSGVIDFTKGCYTGQEVVARMYYRGKPKKRLFLIASEKAFEPAATLVKRQDGEDVDAEFVRLCDDPQPTNPPRYLALVVLPVELAQAGDALTLSSDRKITIEIQTLPYTD